MARLWLHFTILAATLCAASPDRTIDSLRSAANRDARLAIVKSLTTAEAATAFTEIEKEAAARFAANDCKSAAPAYDIAADLASPDQLPLIFRRIGICRTRLGEGDAALAAYHVGVTASERINDR